MHCVTDDCPAEEIAERMADALDAAEAQVRDREQYVGGVEESRDRGAELLAAARPFLGLRVRGSLAAEVDDYLGREPAA
jgi:hypothetical protein